MRKARWPEACNRGAKKLQLTGKPGAEAAACYLDALGPGGGYGNYWKDPRSRDREGRCQQSSGKVQVTQAEAES